MFLGCRVDNPVDLGGADRLLVLPGRHRAFRQGKTGTSGSSLCPLSLCLLNIVTYTIFNDQDIFHIYFRFHILFLSIISQFTNIKGSCLKTRALFYSRLFIICDQSYSLEVRRASQAYQSQENDDSFDNDVAETNATPLRQYQVREEPVISPRVEDRATPDHTFRQMFIHCIYLRTSTPDMWFHKCL